MKSEAWIAGILSVVLTMSFYVGSYLTLRASHVLVCYSDCSGAAINVNYDLRERATLRYSLPVVRIFYKPISTTELALRGY